MSNDNINPQHYRQYPVEAIEIVELLPCPLLGNAVKYIWRAGDKGNKEEDKQKALWYVTRRCSNDKEYYSSLVAFDRVVHKMAMVDGLMSQEKVAAIVHICSLVSSSLPVVESEFNRVKDAIDAV